MLTAGIPAVVLKEWMGHTNIHITLDTYADVFNRMNNEAIKMFEKYTCAIKYVEKNVYNFPSIYKDLKTNIIMLKI